MPNKTRFVIDPNRTYVVKLDDGEEVEVSGLDIIQIGYSIRKTEMIVKAFRDLEEYEETGKGWF
jgi:hypothetical protein